MKTPDFDNVDLAIYFLGAAVLATIAAVAFVESVAVGDVKEIVLAGMGAIAALAGNRQGKVEKDG